MEDRNRKEIDVGDEVTVHFRIAELEKDGSVVLETLHNQRKRETTMVTTGEAAVITDDVQHIMLRTEQFRVILQRKAPKPVATGIDPASPAPAG